MNKISLYTLLILLFLGLSKSFSPSSQKTQYVMNEKVFPSMFSGAPITLILTDVFRAGFLIKTHYLKLDVVHGFKQTQTVVLRTSQSFWEQNKKNIGMSLFRRYERNNRESTTILPPGSLYVGDPAFGAWRYHNSGDRIWHFHRVYRHFSDQFFWGDFKPNYEFFEKLKIHNKNDTAFYGQNNEFGTNGNITSHLYKDSPYHQMNKDESFVDHLWIYVNTPPWSRPKNSQSKKEGS